MERPKLKQAARDGIAYEYRVACIQDALKQCVIALEDLHKDISSDAVAESICRAAYNDLQSATWHVCQLPSLELS